AGLGLTAFAFYQAQLARDAEELAHSNAQRAELSEGEAASLYYATLAQTAYFQNNDIELAISLALEASKNSNAPTLVQDVLKQVGLAAGTRRVFSDPSSITGLLSCDVTPDVKKLLCGTNAGAVIWDVETGQLLHTLRAEETFPIKVVDV